MGGQGTVRSLTVGVWLKIDAMLDNTRDHAEWDQPEVAARAAALRQRGWAANREHPQHGQGPMGWPPVTAPFEIELSDAELDFIRTELERSIAGSERILAAVPPGVAAQEHERSIAVAREALATIEAVRA